MADAGGTFFGLPVALAAPIVLGCMGIVASVTAAMISRRKPGPAPAHVTVNYSNTPSRTAASALRGVSIMFVVLAVLLAGLFVYGRIARGADAVQLVPTQVTTDEAEKSFHKECVGQRIDFGVRNLIDGKNETAWLAGSRDGAGKSVRFTFGSTVHLTMVGLIPGYAAYRPRAERGCKMSDAFLENRTVESVRYEFDNGPSVVQHFQQNREMQLLAVDVTTSSVTVTILATRFPEGADDETLISETYFAGSTAG